MKIRLGVLAAAAVLAGLAGSASWAAEGGAALFADHCQICHQAEGVGVAGMFPRLAGRAPTIAGSAAGRQFLSTLVLNGMSGTVSVDNQPIVGVMPAFDSLSDGDLATILTYVSRLGGGKTAPFKPGEIATGRTGGRLSPAQVAALRNRLAADKVIP